MSSYTLRYISLVPVHIQVHFVGFSRQSGTTSWSLYRTHLGTFSSSSYTFRHILSYAFRCFIGLNTHLGTFCWSPYTFRVYLLVSVHNEEHQICLRTQSSKFRWFLYKFRYISLVSVHSQEHPVGLRTH